MVRFYCPHLHLVAIVKSQLLLSSPQSLQLLDLIVLFIQLPKQKHSMIEQPIPSKTQPRTARKNLTRAHTCCLKLLTVKHALHAPPRTSRSSHAPPRGSHAWHYQHLSISALGWHHPAHVSISRHSPTSAHISSWLLTVDFLHWLFGQSQKISTGPVLLSFSRKFQFWAPFLHLRSLNPTFCSVYHHYVGWSY